MPNRRRDGRGGIRTQRSRVPWRTGPGCYAFRDSSPAQHRGNGNPKVYTSDARNTHGRAAMNAPKTRGAAIAANCRDCIHDPAATGTWKEQVSCCATPGCPFWRFRPLSGNAPAWLQSRNPADLPAGWVQLHHDEAIRRLRGTANDNPSGCAVQANDGTRAPYPVRPQGGAPATPPVVPETRGFGG